MMMNALKAVMATEDGEDHGWEFLSILPDKIVINRFGDTGTTWRWESWYIHANDYGVVYIIMVMCIGEVTLPTSPRRVSLGNFLAAVRWYKPGVKSRKHTGVRARARVCVSRKSMVACVQP